MYPHAEVQRRTLSDRQARSRNVFSTRSAPKIKAKGELPVPLLDVHKHHIISPLPATNVNTVKHFAQQNARAETAAKLKAPSTSWKARPHEVDEDEVKETLPRDAPPHKFYANNITVTLDLRSALVALFPECFAPSDRELAASPDRHLFTSQPRLPPGTLVHPFVEIAGLWHLLVNVNGVALGEVLSIYLDLLPPPSLSGLSIFNLSDHNQLRSFNNSILRHLEEDYLARPFDRARSAYHSHRRNASTSQIDPRTRFNATIAQWTEYVRAMSGSWFSDAEPAGGWTIAALSLLLEKLEELTPDEQFHVCRGDALGDDRIKKNHLNPWLLKAIRQVHSENPLTRLPSSFHFGSSLQPAVAEPYAVNFASSITHGFAADFDGWINLYRVGYQYTFDREPPSAAVRSLLTDDIETALSTFIKSELLSYELTPRDVSRPSLYTRNKAAWDLVTSLIPTPSTARTNLFNRLLRLLTHLLTIINGLVSVPPTTATTTTTTLSSLVISGQAGHAILLLHHMRKARKPSSPGAPPQFDVDFAYLGAAPFGTMLAKPVELAQALAPYLTSHVLPLVRGYDESDAAMAAAYRPDGTRQRPHEVLGEVLDVFSWRCWTPETRSVGFLAPNSSAPLAIDPVWIRLVKKFQEKIDELVPPQASPSPNPERFNGAFGLLIQLIVKDGKIPPHCILQGTAYVSPTHIHLLAFDCTRVRPDKFKALSNIPDRNIPSFSPRGLLERVLTVSNTPFHASSGATRGALSSATPATFLHFLHTGVYAAPFTRRFRLHPTQPDLLTDLSRPPSVVSDPSLLKPIGANTRGGMPANIPSLAYSHQDPDRQQRRLEEDRARLLDDFNSTRPSSEHQRLEEAAPYKSVHRALLDTVGGQLDAGEKAIAAINIFARSRRTNSIVRRQGFIRQETIQHHLSTAQRRSSRLTNRITSRDGNDPKSRATRKTILHFNRHSRLRSRAQALSSLHQRRFWRCAVDEVLTVMGVLHMDPLGSTAASDPQPPPPISNPRKYRPDPRTRQQREAFNALHLPPCATRFVHLNSIRRSLVVFLYGGSFRSNRKGSHGVSTANTFTRYFSRQLRIICNRRGIPFLERIVPEQRTSQLCPNPDCTHLDPLRKTNARHQLKDVTHEEDEDWVENRIKYCSHCGKAFHRDVAAAFNIWYIYWHLMVWGTNPYWPQRGPEEAEEEED